MPEAVREATADYRDDSDRISRFIEAWLEPRGNEEVRTAAAYKLYTSWCDKYGFFRENSKNFNAALSQRFPIQKKRPRGGGSVTTLFIGCRFREHENGEDVAGGDFDELPDISEAAGTQISAVDTGTPEPSEKSLCPF